MAASSRGRCGTRSASAISVACCSHSSKKRELKTGSARFRRCSMRARTMDRDSVKRGHVSVPAQPSKRLEGRLRIVVRDAHGVSVAEREVTNIVLRSGAELIAGLFRGAVTTPVNGVAVGVNSTASAPPYEATALTTTALDGTAVVQQTTSPLDPAKMQT